MPRFSVVIPAYNAECTIAETIRSVLAQTESDLELVVVDDGSSDSTPKLVGELAATDPRLCLIEQQNAGTAGARNTGIASSEGGLVCFIDNDDLWMPRYLEAMSAALAAEPHAGFAYCDAWSLEDATQRLRRRTELQARPAPPRRASWEEVVVALAAMNFVMSSTMVRRSAIADTGGFRTDVLGVDDYDLWLRIVLTGRTAVRGGSEPLLLQRDRHDSQSKDDSMMLEGLRRTLERALAEPQLPPAARAVIEGRLHEGDRSRSAAGRFAASLRRAAVALRDRARGDRAFVDRIPDEVAAAFPRLRGARG